MPRHRVAPSASPMTGSSGASGNHRRLLDPAYAGVTVGAFRGFCYHFACENSVGVLPVTCRNACEKAGTLA